MELLLLFLGEVSYTLKVACCLVFAMWLKWCCCRYNNS